jgi:hypothetical protein
MNLDKDVVVLLEAESDQGDPCNTPSILGSPANTPAHFENFTEYQKKSETNNAYILNTGRLEIRF